MLYRDYIVKINFQYCGLVRSFYTTQNDVSQEVQYTMNRIQWLNTKLHSY